MFITGHTGFKGSWLTIWLLKLGAKVIGYALDPKNDKDNFVLAGLGNKIKDYRSDIRDLSKLNEVISKEKPEIIFHLAAQPLVLESYENPHFTIETNTQGTANILEAFRLSTSAKVLIAITTDKVYKNNEWEWGYRENDVLGGNDPYSASKAAAELLIYSYQKSFFGKNNQKLITSVRAGNVIGGGDWSENRIVPDCIKSLENNEKIKIRNPYATRPWQYVLEPLRGYLMLGEKLLQENKDYEGAWNFGPEPASIISVEEMVKKIINMYGKGEFLNSSNKYRLREATCLSLDVTKAKSKLGWTSVLDISQTIRFTIDWYKRYQREDVNAICHDQINQYMKLWKLKSG